MLRFFVGVLSLCIAVACAAVYAANDDEMFEPAPLTVPTGMALADVRAAIIDAADRRSWLIVDSPSGQFTLRQTVSGNHSADVLVRYDAHQVLIQYISSVNLNYREKGSQKVIHPRYNVWIRNLRDDIQAAFSVAAISS
jgi:hypothetical protein